MNRRHRLVRTRLAGIAGASLFLLLALGLSCSSDGGKSNGVDAAEVEEVAVYPLAGTPDASAKSEISFRGVAPDGLSGVKVVGSRSGRHAGRLLTHSDRDGVSFVPAKPFKAGEVVRVRADLPLVGARRGAVSFRIASPPGGLAPQEAFPDGSKPIVPGANRYLSRRDLHPAGVKITRSRPEASDSLVFLAPKGGPGQNGPLILDRQGRIVWFHPLQAGFKTYDFRVQSYEGKPVLTWWQGDAPGAYGGGTGLLVDSSYRVIATVKGANGYQPDIHEFRLTPQGTALVLVYVPVRWDLRAAGGPNGKAALDSIAQEIDIKTGRVLFEWHSLGHIPLSESYSKYVPGHPIDYTHLNSVSLDNDGNFLISARNTWSVYKVDRRTGKIMWRLGGKRSTFKMPKSSYFVGQHDFERAADGTYTLFDNGSILPPPRRPSRGLVFSIDAGARKAQLVRALREPQGRGTFSQGSVQVLPNGHYVIGWGGGNPEVSEFGPSGRLLFNARLLPKVESYRAYRGEWQGRPRRGPDVAVVTRKGRTTLYASWNGATDVRTWEVVAGPTRARLDAAHRVRWRGFETALPVPQGAAFVAVRALDGSGELIAESKTLQVRRS